jgi:uncharacterized protein (TIGR03382 family)
MPFMRFASALAAVMLVPSLASAHAVLTYPAPRGTAIKDGPCGGLNSTRGTTVTALTGGQMITVKWNETIDHPGHYRISLDMDGQDFPDPTSFNGNTEGMPNVIKDLIPDLQGAPLPGAPRPYEYTFMLPDVTCTNCTIQLIQMMTENPPFDVAGDVYFHCADITITASSSGGADAGVDNTPDAGTGGGSNNGSGEGGEISGGCSTGNATGLLALLGLVGLRRRRR